MKSSNRAQKKKTGNGPLLRFDVRLPYRPPFDWSRMLNFFQFRAIPGVEFVAGGVYHRAIRIRDTFGLISVAHAASGHALLLTAALSDDRDLEPVIGRVRRMFDLDADMGAIHHVLGMDPVLKRVIGNQPGLRLPGAWDSFEVAVRAIVGQQISVKGACTVIGRIAERAGPMFESSPLMGVDRFFPSPRELVACHLHRIGMPEKRAATVRLLAQAVVGETVRFEINGSLSNFIAQLAGIPGIGDWTAQYIAMRALGETDAFPAADLGIARALQEGDKRPTVKQIRQRAEKWRPYRAYGAIYLWHT